MYEVFNLYLPLIPYDIMPVKLHNCNLLLPKMFKYILYGIRIVMKLFLFVSQNIMLYALYLTEASLLLPRT